VRFFSGKGLDIDCPNAAGTTPQAAAEAGGHRPVVAFLKKERLRRQSVQWSRESAGAA